MRINGNNIESKIHRFLFLQKFPAPETIKPPRYQPPSQKKNPPQDSPPSLPVCDKTFVKKPSRPLTNSEKTIRITNTAKKSPSKHSGNSEKSKPQPRPRKSQDAVDAMSVTIYTAGGGSMTQDTVDSAPLPVPPVCVPPPPPPPPMVPPPPPPPSGGGPPPKLVIVKKERKEEKPKGAGPPDLGSILAGKSKLKPVSESQQKQKPVTGEWLCSAEYKYCPVLGIKCSS